MVPGKHILYHGGPPGITRFRESTDGVYGPGIYLTPHPEKARTYAEQYGPDGVIYTVEVELRTPHTIHNQKMTALFDLWNYTDVTEADMANTVLREKGHDSLWVHTRRKDPLLGDEVVVFDPYAITIIDEKRLSQATKLGSLGRLNAGDLITNEVVTFNDTLGLHLLNLEVSYVPPGSFIMGSPNSDPEAFPDEKPQHKVTLTKAIAVARTPVTNEQWFAVMGNNPSKFKGLQNPVDSISWNEAVEFCARLSSIAADGNNYRLLTEAEWEYACRAGSVSIRYGKLDDIAWYDKNSGDHTHPVGRKNPNNWNIYDTLGNICEWTQDIYGKYSSNNQVDPKGAPFGPYRVLRGGAWGFVGKNSRAAGIRDNIEPNYRSHSTGFRICYTLE